MSYISWSFFFNSSYPKIRKSLKFQFLANYLSSPYFAEPKTAINTVHIHTQYLSKKLCSKWYLCNFRLLSCSGIKVALFIDIRVLARAITANKWVVVIAVDNSQCPLEENIRALSSSWTNSGGRAGDTSRTCLPSLKKGQNKCLYLYFLFYSMHFARYIHTWITKQVINDSGSNRTSLNSFKNHTLNLKIIQW